MGTPTPGQSLEALIAAATNEDWLSVADLLDDDFTELLPVWRTVLSAFATRESVSDADCASLA